MVTPGVITKLDENVINRIAAGEIIQRPANAVKELIENSLDAKSTSIQVIVKSGGIKLLQIIDNGTGIRKENMDIVCHRFTTSKLISFDDLSDIATFGFRGEALASISHVAHLTIQTKTKTEPSAYRGLYEDGRLIGPLSLCAGSQGTIITVEDLFFNIAQRKQALKSSLEEFQKIADVIIKYAIHNPTIAFSLKKYGDNPFIRTFPNSSEADNIKKLYGSQIYQHLISLQCDDDLYKFQMKALVTNVSYTCKKTTFILFINNRLVECPNLKSRIELAYSLFLSKGAHPFMYMSLEIDSRNVDVNIHPTKNEVHFLNEIDIIQRIGTAVEEQLLKSKATKKVYQQLKLSQLPDELQVSNSDEVHNTESVKANNTVRTDARNQKLEKFLVNPLLETNTKKMCEKKCRSTRRTTYLSSVIALRNHIQYSCNEGLRKILKSMVFVGVINKTFTLFQYETKLYLCNILKLSEELFYQLMINNFGELKKIQFTPNLHIQDLIVVEMEFIGWKKTNEEKIKLAAKAAEFLKDKSLLLHDYFSLDINENGALETIPLLLEDYVPSTTFLPTYVLNISTKVHWENEKDCFETFCRETAKFYSSVTRTESMSKKRKWVIEHIISPSIKKHLLPSDKIQNYMYEVTNLQQLYKVFERC